MEKRERLLLRTVLSRHITWNGLPCSTVLFEMISVLIFTKNEELDLPGCLESVSWSDDVHVFDSFSSDETVGIATRSGAHVQQRIFDNYAAQKNAGLKSGRFRHEWVVLLDADERIPKPLAQEMMRFAVETSPTISAARLRRRDFFMGTWLKHAQISPFYIRLVRPEKVHYEREVNEVLKVEGHVSELREPFDHFPFSKGVGHWIEKHNTYSTMEARITFDSRQSGQRFSFWKAAFAKDFHERRYHQKGISLRLPCRPFIKFGYMFLVRRAFLDGKAGLAYAILQSFYEYWIILKTGELESAFLKHRQVPARDRREAPPGKARSGAVSLSTPAAESKLEADPLG